MAGSGLKAAVASLCAAVDELLECELSTESAGDLAGLFAEFEVQRRRLEAVDHVLIAQLAETRLAGEFGSASTADLLGSLSRLSPGEARSRVRAARDLGPRREITGAVLAPLFARVADAQRAGTVSAEHAKVITRAVAA